MEENFKIPENIPVIDKPEDYDKIPGVKIVEKQPDIQIQRPQLKPGIKTTEKTYEGYTIPDNISVYERPEDVYEIPSNIPIQENTEDDVIVPEIKISDEELDIWSRIEEEFDLSNFLIEDNTFNNEKLFSWLKEKLSGISFCQTYLTTKLDGDNGIEKENSTLMLESDNGSKFFLNKAGKYHRLDGPAIEWFYGANEYFKNGIRHRMGGAAYENKDEKQFWFEGKEYSESEYWKISQEIENLK